MEQFCPCFCHWMSNIFLWFFGQAKLILHHQPSTVLHFDVFLFKFFFFFVTTVVSQWDFTHGKFRLPSPGKASCDSCTTQPTVHSGCFSVPIIHRTLTWTTGSLTCAQMLMQAITHGVTDTHKRVCTESWLWEKNSLPHQGIEPVSAACQSDAKQHPQEVAVLLHHAESVQEIVRVSISCTSTV